MIEFGSGEFDAKIGGECRPDPAVERGRTKRNNDERKRSDFHGFPTRSDHIPQTAGYRQKLSRTLIQVSKFSAK